MKVRKGDRILIISGKDRGKKAKVLRAFPAENLVLVEGVNLVKKHVRRKKAGEKGQIITKPAPISVSKLKLICLKCDKAVRVGYKIVNDKKYRVCRKCGEET